jgi:hypothetical protein
MSRTREQIEAYIKMSHEILKELNEVDRAIAVASLSTDTNATAVLQALLAHRKDLLSQELPF